MNIVEIPFAKTVGLESYRDNRLQLRFRADVLNHLEGIHASAVFMLAESASGQFLQTCFPDLVGKVVPVLRDAQVKFRKPALQSIYAVASLDTEKRGKFSEQIRTKERGSIAIDVCIYDQDETLIMTGMFSWFVQALKVG